MASDHINYAIRPNKSVERKLIFEALIVLEPSFPFGQYEYIGFGSLWFVDFVLAHRLLGINKMISIQSGSDHAKRARFNAPFSCIRVEEGDAAKVLPDIPVERGPVILWLDYESRIDAILEELGQICSRLASGSILIVTANATKDRVEMKEESDRRAVQESAFRSVVGNLAPAVFTSDFFDTTKYPNNVADTLLKHLTRATRISGRDERFEMLFNFSYRDNAPMITVGGMIANAADRERLRRVDLRNRLSFGQPEQQVTIAVPPLTTKEKLVLDQFFPAEVVPTPEAMNQLGFPLKPAYLEAYRRYYKRYPVFAEFFP